MTMKFKVDEKAHGYAMKKEILSWIDAMKRVTVWNIKDLLDDDTITQEDKDYSWDLDSLKKDRKIRVRFGKRDQTWYLYLPDPEYTPCEDPSDPILDDETMAFLDRLTELAIGILEYGKDTRRECVVTRAKKMIPAWFHCWTMNQVIKDDKIVTDLLAVCEFDDGHVERVKFDKIQFI